MTGEVNLRGNVTAIGGLKEKLLAALRGGIKKVLIPQENEKDLPEIPKNVLRKLEIVPVSTIDEVLSHALLHMPVPLESIKNSDIEQISSKSAENKGADVIHH